MTTTTNNSTTTFILWSCDESRTETVENAPASCMVEMETKSQMSEMLDDLYLKQGNSYTGEKIDHDMTSMSIGDVVQVHHENEDETDEFYAVARVGFIKITGNIFVAWKACDRRDRNWLIRDIESIKLGQIVPRAL